MTPRPPPAVPLLLAFALALGPLGSAAAGARGPTPALAVPRVDRYRWCTVCHGAQARGNPAVQAPRLAGLPPWYLFQALRAYQAGWRGTDPAAPAALEMREVALALTPAAARAAIAELAAYPRPAARTASAGDPGRGARLYERCAPCHGAHAEGRESLGAPPLAGQNDWYLRAALDAFRLGARGAAPDDTRGQTMRGALADVEAPDADRDLVAYLATLTTDGLAPSDRQEPATRNP